MSDEKAFELIERVTAYYRKLRDAWYSRPLAPADEYTGAVIHPIIEPVLSPDGATVVGGRRVGATFHMITTLRDRESYKMRKLRMRRAASACAEPFRRQRLKKE